MTRPRLAVESRDAGSGGSLAERLVLLFLVAAALVLAYVWFHVMPARRPPTLETFDLRNTMLDAEVGECIEIESTTNPGTLICVVVRDPGVVLRPPSGPDQLGIYRGLRRSRPYLACDLRYPPPGKRCSDGAPGREEIELFDLNALGMPYGVDVMLDSIRPRWVQHGGRQVFVYEAQLTQYGHVAGQAWLVDLHPDAPVTGNLRRRHGTERGELHTTIFTPAKSCP